LHDVVSRLPLHIATVPLDITTLGDGQRIVEVGVYPVRLTLSDGRGITPINVPAEVDIHGVAITFDFRGSSLIVNDHGAEGIRIVGDVFGLEAG
jgi:hypothetical protein